MKVAGIVASPRKDGNTTDMIKHALQYLQKKEVETHLYNLFDFKIKPCGVDCNVECYEQASSDGRICPIDDTDELARFVEIINEVDGVILGTPCYSFDVPAQLKAYLERSELKEYKDKVVGIIALASLGGIHTVSTITSNLIHHAQPIIAGWTILTRFYREKGQAIRERNNRESVEKLAHQMYLHLKRYSEMK